MSTILFELLLELWNLYFIASETISYGKGRGLSHFLFISTLKSKIGLGPCQRTIYERTRAFVHGRNPGVRRAGPLKLLGYQGLNCNQRSLDLLGRIGVALHLVATVIKKLRSKP